MRYQPKDKKTTILMIVAAIAAVLIAKSMGFASTRSATIILYVSNEGRSNWSANYTMLDGTMQKKVHTDDGRLSISVVTESGSISIKVKDQDGNLVFDENNLETSSFEVEVSKKAVVHIEADHHKGSFSMIG